MGANPCASSLSDPDRRAHLRLFGRGQPDSFVVSVHRPSAHAVTSGLPLQSDGLGRGSADVQLSTHRARLRHAQHGLADPSAQGRPNLLCRYAADQQHRRVPAVGGCAEQGLACSARSQLPAQSGRISRPGMRRGRAGHAFGRTFRRAAGGAWILVLWAYRQRRLLAHLPLLSEPARGRQQHCHVLSHLLDPAEPPHPGACRAADRHCHRPAVGGCKAPLHCRPSAARLPACVWAVLHLRRPHDVGLFLRPHSACGRALFGNAARTPHGGTGRRRDRRGHLTRRRHPGTSRNLPPHG